MVHNDEFDHYEVFYKAMTKGTGYYDDCGFEKPRWLCTKEQMDEQGKKWGTSLDDAHRRCGIHVDGPGKPSDAFEDINKTAALFMLLNDPDSANKLELSSLNE